MLDLITLLFAPGGCICCRSTTGGLRSRPPAAEAEAAAVTARLAALDGDYALTDNGFVLLVGHGHSRAAVELGDLALPARRDDYLNLALTLAGAFDLALANARSFGRLDRARQELRASEERYRALMDQASDAIVLVDVRGTVLEANGQALRAMGKSRDEVVGRGMDDIRDPGIRQAVHGGFDEFLRSGTASMPGIRLKRAGAGDLVIDANFSLVEVAGCRIIQGIFRDVTDRERSARELEALSLEDALTGLRNRRGFTMLAEQQLKSAARLGRPLLLLFADVDGLKPVNDRQGHAAGDVLLCETAEVLADCFRDMDIVARMGGDEFAVLQIDAGAEAEPAALRRITAATAAANATPGRTHELSLSLGAAAFDPAAPCTIDQLLSLADKRNVRGQARASRRGSRQGVSLGTLGRRAPPRPGADRAGYSLKRNPAAKTRAQAAATSAS